MYNPLVMFDKLLALEEQPYTEEDAEWDTFVTDHPQGSLLQTTAWTQLKNNFGWSSQRIWLRKDGQLMAGAQILIKTAFLGIVRVGYIPHGPLVNWEDAEQVEVLFHQMDLAAYERRLGFIKMEPFIWQTDPTAKAWTAVTNQFDLVTKTDTIQPANTAVIDLRPTFDDIMAAMKSKTRYNIRLSARKGVVVRQGTVADLPAFNHLMRLTSQRDGFGVHDPQYYQRAYEVFSPDKVALFIAEYEERPLAAIMVFAFGQRAAYLYGASSNENGTGCLTMAYSGRPCNGPRRRAAPSMISGVFPTRLMMN